MPLAFPLSRPAGPARFRLARPALAALLLSAAVVLAGCESREEKAERFYQSALALLAAGDEDRAMVEFRNVFDNDGFHKEARQAYADLRLARGEVTEAYGQYLRLVEQYPDTPEVRETLGEIAVVRGDWEEAERHGREAFRLAPDSPRAQALDVALRYRQAALDEEGAAAEEAAREARVLLAAHPDLDVARRVVIDHAMAGPNPQDALPEVDRALEAAPEDFPLHIMRFRLLAEAEDMAGTGEQLRRMHELFPDNEEVRTALIRWHLAQDDLDGAEAFLRELAGAPTGATEGHVTVVQFLQAARGADAARAELDRLAEASAGTPNGELYRAMRAGLDFEAGDEAGAIAAFEEVLAGAEPSDQTRRIKAMLARMLVATGNQVGARARVEEILAEDATNADALKLRAASAIQEDRPSDAIVDLRAALSQDSRDVEALTLMAEAHERDGSPDLAAERLAVAVEVSDSAPDPSLRYAEFLLRQGRDGVARTVLTDARESNPGDLRLLLRLADLWLGAEDVPKVRQAIAELQANDAPEAQEAAQRLEAALLLAQDRTEDGLALLRSIAAEGDAGAVGTAVEAMVRDGRAAEARTFLAAELARDPESRELRLIGAGLDAVSGDLAAAEAGYRALLDEEPGLEVAVRQLYTLLASQNRAEEATAVLDEALAAAPRSALLRWIKAGELERAGRIDEAVAVYEELYADDSSNVVVANNLASLLAAHRDDAQSLDRAYAVARRLREVPQPAFQDTYGWIAFRRGNPQEALEYLEPAARGLPEDALTQLHLGLAYAGLDRTDDAVRQIERALEIAGDSALPQWEDARETLAALRAEGGPAPADPAPADPASADAPPVAATSDAAEAEGAPAP